MPNATVGSPPKEANTASTNRQIRRAPEKSWLGWVKPAMPAMATTTSTAGETIRASTAALPTTKPPKIEAVCPIAAGR